jgi:tetratricopeptide (TPR) repeat protein
VPQNRLFGWILAVIRALARDKCTLLVIEDMHWADRSTRDFTQYLVHSLRSERLAVVATVRADEPHTDVSARKFLSELVRDERVSRIDLPALSTEEVALQLTALLGHEPPPGLVTSLSSRADGNPFYVEALLDTAVSDGAIPPTIRDALLLIVEELSPSTGELVRACALSGRPVGHKVLNAATELPEPEFRVALREAIEHHVLVADRDTGDFRCRHTLLAETVQADLNAAESAALHAALARALETADGHAHPAELAWHWEAAGCLPAALRATFAAGRWSSGMSAYHEAVRHFERAADLWTKCHPTETEFDFDLIEILSAAAEASRWTGDFEHALTLCRDALNKIDEAREPLRTASLYERMGRYQPWDIEASRRAYAKALALLPEVPTVQRARLLTDDALALIWDARWRDAKTRAEEALTTALIAKGPAEEGSARAALGVAAAFLGDAAAGEQELRQALVLVQRHGTTEEVATVRLSLGDVLRLMGKTAAAATVMQEGAHEASIQGAEAYAGFMEVSAADDLFAIGRWDRIEERLANVNHRALSLTGRLLLAIVRGRVATARGRLNEAREAFEGAQQMSSADVPSDFVTVLQTGLAELELAQDRPDAARALVSEGVEALGDHPDPLYAPDLFSLGVRIETDLACSADGAVDSNGMDIDESDGGQPPSARPAARAEALLERFRGLYSNQADRLSSLPIAEAHLAQAEAEIMRLRDGPAGDAWAGVADQWLALGHLPAYAYALSMEAEVRLNSAGNDPLAAEALESALSVAEQLGAPQLLDRISALGQLGDQTLRSS